MHASAAAYPTAARERPVCVADLQIRYLRWSERHRTHMYLRIHDVPDSVQYDLIEPQDYTRLHVSAPGVPHHVVGELLLRAAIGKSATYPHVWLDISALKALAAGQDPQQARRFDGMIAHAESKGWLDDTGTYVQAHLTPDGNDRTPRSATSFVP